MALHEPTWVQDRVCIVSLSLPPVDNVVAMLHPLVASFVAPELVAASTVPGATVATSAATITTAASRATVFPTRRQYPSELCVSWVSLCPSTRIEEPRQLGTCDRVRQVLEPVTVTVTSKRKRVVADAVRFGTAIMRGNRFNEGPLG
jgi:hypothetical protein